MRGAGLLSLAAILLCSNVTSAQTSDFVRVEGTRFTSGGAPFHFVGANVSIMHGPRERAAVDTVLDAVVADGLSVVRVWALGEAVADSEPWRRDYAFRLGVDGWLETSFVHLDRVLAAARQRDLKVIVVLANRWEDYGGVPRYLAWAGHDVEGDVPALELGDFYGCHACRRQYLAHLRRVVGRRNSITGVRYADDPTIFAWELINEASAHTEASADALVGWTRAMARQVREIDGNHLVSAGHIGYGHGSERVVWLRVMQLSEIDYADSHAYPLRDSRVRSPGRLARWVDDRVQLAHHVIGKPIVFGEIGFARAASTAGLSRSAWFDRFFGAAFRDGAAGALVWIYGDFAGRLRNHAIDAAGDRGVRRVLARHARRLRRRTPSERNPRLGAGVDDRSLFPYRSVVRGGFAPHRAWRSEADLSALEIPPLELHRAEFERVGIYEEEPPHAYGVGAGEVQYRFVVPRRLRSASELRVELRLSSELPGAGGGATDTGDVTVLIDDHAIGSFRAPPDDGLGAVRTVALDDDTLLRRLLRRRSMHTLTIRADTPPGLCVYATSDGELAPVRIILR